MQQHHEQVAPTEGHLIRWPRFYDGLLTVFFLGREDRFRQRILERAQLGAGEHVLDVGCGTGTLALLTAEKVGHSGHVRGVDPAPEMIGRARDKARKAGVPIEFQVGTAEELPVPDASQDVVVNTFLLHHLPCRLQPLALAEMGRVLKPGGRLLLVDFGRAKRIRRRLSPMVESAGFRPATFAPLRPLFFSLVAYRGARSVH